METYIKAGLMRPVYENDKFMIYAFCETFYYIFDKNADGLVGAKINADNIRKVVADPSFADKYFEFVGNATAAGITLDFDKKNLGQIRYAADYLKKQDNTGRMNPEMEAEIAGK